jgi:hypothetical protein
MAYFQGCIHRWLTFRGISDVNLQRIWKLKIPKKIKVYLWQGYSLPTKEQVFVERNREANERINKLFNYVYSIDDQHIYTRGNRREHGSRPLEEV